MASEDVTHDELRPLLFSLAYRMVGGVGEAEDLVQEAYLRLLRSEEDVESPKAFLTTVVTRLAIDHLRSARVRREAYVGPWLPEPLVSETAPGPAELAESDETLSLAFLTLLERLTPVERAVYVLHELFGYSHDEVSEIVEKSPANCRQILARARRHVEAGRPRFEPSRDRREALLARFLDAVRMGDVDGLVGLLAADVNGQPGVAATGPDGTVLSVITVDVADDRVQAVWAVVNPDKLARVPPYSAAT